MDVALLTNYVDKNFPGFGLNKSHSIVRLLAEISRRDSCDPTQILPPEIIAAKDFHQAKNFLLTQRYPSLTADEFSVIPPLTEFHCDKTKRQDITTVNRFPRKVFIEKAVSDAPLALRLRRKLPNAFFATIDKYAEHIKNEPFSIEGFNRRTETLFVVEENYDFFLHCPCSKPSRPCIYHIMNAGMGCVYECVYCYLQGYTNSPGIIVPGNLRNILEKFKSYYRPGMRLGTGQFTDSLAMDDLLEFSPTIINFFRDYPDVQFEFKTKSDQVDNMLTTPSSPNILVSWSVNPQSIIDSCEFLSASLEERLSAAKKCAEAGYSVGFHFDPIIVYEGWQDDYQKVIDGIFNAVDDGKISWISLGCLRMAPKVHQVMEQRFPDSKLLLAEQIIGFDQKLRYPRRIRKEVYQHMLKQIRAYSDRVSVYLCMEDEQMNQELDIPLMGSCNI